jgi:hypothetical protein
LKQAISPGIKLPVEGGGALLLSTVDVWKAKDVDDHKKIFRMAAEQILEVFPVEEVEHARRK